MFSLTDSAINLSQSIHIYTGWLKKVVHFSTHHIFGFWNRSRQNEMDLTKIFPEFLGTKIRM